ncbi:MAG TPA: hypothetical protein VFE63_17995 [Roseiarcus sp.]|jgi:hypothetical protein|nr:hypothetical protein [Roseiarcus sp.]
MGAPDDRDRSGSSGANSNLAAALTLTGRVAEAHEVVQRFASLHPAAPDDRGGQRAEGPG